MKFKNLLVGLALFFSIGGASFFGYRYYPASHRQCDLCGRPVHSHMQAAVYLKSRARIDTCCPRCALHYEIGRSGDVARITVADGNTGEVMNAAQAIYLEGSDAESCHPDPGSTPREPGVGYDRTFDRCLPSLIAFRTEAEARDSQKQYGGRILSFAQALQNVKGH